MFQSTKKRIRAVLDVVDEMLAEPLEPVVPHPHRRPARLAIARRAGSVTPRPMHCLCPVRPSTGRGRDRVS